MANWTTSHSSKEDLPQVAHFFKNQYQGQGSYGELGMFQWKIIDNFSAPGILNLVKDSETIAATTSITPKLLHLNDSEVLAAEIGDTYTDKNYQRQGMFSLLVNQSRKDANEQGIQFIYGTPNHQSLPGYEKKANFKVIPKLGVSSFVYPVNNRELISQKTNWLLGLMTSPLLELASMLNYKLRCIINPSLSEYHVKEISEIPKEWDKFWNTAKLDYDFIFSRSTKAFKWRFFKNPNKYTVLGVYKKEDLVGYLTYRIQSNESSSRLIIADYLFKKSDEKALGKALKITLKKAFSIGASSVVTWSSDTSSYFKTFSRYGFLKRGTIPVITHFDDFWKKLENVKNYHFTVSDSDNV